MSGKSLEPLLKHVRSISLLIWNSVSIKKSLAHSDKPGWALCFLFLFPIYFSGNKLQHKNSCFNRVFWDSCWNRAEIFELCFWRSLFLVAVIFCTSLAPRLPPSQFSHCLCNTLQPNALLAESTAIGYLSGTKLSLQLKSNRKRERWERETKTLNAAMNFLFLSVEKFRV